MAVTTAWLDRLRRRLGFARGMRELEASLTATATAPDDGGALTLAAVLDAMARHSFDLETRDAKAIQAAFEAWAAHVRTGKPVPPERDTARGTQRRWAALQRFFVDHRKDEASFVVAGLGDLRRLMWLLVSAVARGIAKDQDADTRVLQQMGRMKQALEGSSLDEVRRIGLQTVQAVSEITEARRQRHHAELTELGGKLRELRSELEAARRALAVDGLTRLYNRAAFDQQIARINDLAIFGGKPACLMMVDIDFFKKVNDTHGHPAGDSLLKGVGQVLIQAFPRRNDFVARYGGEEFAVVLQEDGIDVGRVLARKLVEKVRGTEFRHGELTLRATISVGVAELVRGEAPSAWIARADAALYEAKRGGRDRVVEAAGAGAGAAA